MSRALDQLFGRCRAENRCAFVPYLMLGDPDAGATLALAQALARGGADLLELGLPFSDPPADGPVLQRAAERALAAGMNTKKALKLLVEIKATTGLPLSLLCYANPIERYGVAAFYRDMAAAGVDAVLVADVPVEEVAPYAEAARQAGIAPVLLASALSSPERLRQIGSVGGGYVYATARVGITGQQQQVAANLSETVAAIAAGTGLPVVVGFGLAAPQHLQAVATAGADGAIIGSALAQRLQTFFAEGKADLAAAALDLEQFAQSCRAACVRPATPLRSPVC
ncbi:MAG: tryptophan synthase subunit alpha [Deltaproteobacteria bacterium]|nr:tryptophan synthase subunit alpha [Deltaproteobacteria bacterium]